MRFKKFFAGMTAAALAASMMVVLPVSAADAADLKMGDTLLKEDGSPVIAKAAFASGDWGAQDWSSSIEVKRGTNTLRITPKDNEGNGVEVKGKGASVFCIDMEGIYEQYPNMNISVSKVTLVTKKYKDDGTLDTKEDGTPKVKNTVLKAPNLEKPEKDAATTLDYAKIVTGDPEGKGNWRIELYNSFGSTKEDGVNPFKGIENMEYDYIDVTFSVWDDTTLEKNVYSDFVIDASAEYFDGYYEAPASEDSKARAYRNFIYLCGEFEDVNKPSKDLNCWDLSTVTGVTFFIKGNEELLAKRDWSGFGIGFSCDSANWYQVESTNMTYQLDDAGNYTDADGDGYADLIKPGSLVKVKDGLYAITVVKQPGDYGANDTLPGFFADTDTNARIWLNDWNNDESGEAVFQLDHVVLNPSPENVYLQDKIKVADGTHEKQTYTAPKWDDFNTAAEPSEPSEPSDDQPTDGETLIGDVNGDGKINVTDVSKVAAHVKGVKALTTDKQKAAADANFDTKINVTDVSKIAAHVKGIKKLEAKPADEPQDPDNDPTSAEVENLPYDAFLMFTNSSWGWGNWNGHSTSAADKGAYGVDAILNGDGEYTVSITPESLETPDPAVEADAELGIHDAGIYRDEATGEIIPSEGATVFCVDITGICDGTMTWDGEATKKGTQKKFTDADPTTDIMGKGRYTGQELTVKVTSIKADGVELDFDESKFVYGNIEDNNNRYRIEIYNEYGSTKDDPGIDFANLKFSKELSVTFTIEGLTKG